MIPILSPEGAEAIEEIAHSSTFLAFAFDGTLAPIVPDRNAAQLGPETRALLRTVAMMQPCAVVSGRSRADVLSRLTRVPFVAVVGNHGAEAAFGPVDRETQHRVASWRMPLQQAFDGAEGIEVEDKKFSIAVHYRAAPSRDEAEQRILSAARSLPAARVFVGNAVVNLVPEGAPTKGDALRSLCQRIGARVAVYVGDDITDEDAFAAEVVRYSIRIGAAQETAARFSLPDQRAVDDFLRALLSARSRQDGLDGGWQGLVRSMAT